MAGKVCEYVRKSEDKVTAAMDVYEELKESGIDCRIELKGRYTSGARASKLRVGEIGRVRRSTEFVDYSMCEVKMKFGVVSIKVWIDCLCLNWI